MINFKNTAAVFLVLGLGCTAHRQSINRPISETGKTPTGNTLHKEACFIPPGSEHYTPSLRQAEELLADAEYNLDQSNNDVALEQLAAARCVINRAHIPWASLTFKTQPLTLGALNAQINRTAKIVREAFINSTQINIDKYKTAVTYASNGDNSHANYMELNFSQVKACNHIEVLTHVVSLYNLEPIPVELSAFWKQANCQYHNPPLTRVQEGYAF